MSEQVRVNITQRVNGDMIREETRNGREVIVVRSATLPDNVVMNGIRYPADEIKASFASLEGTPAPLGHPVSNGEFISAKSPLGLSIGWFGAYNENVRQDNGRVMVDKVIDKERANESKMGQRVLNAIKEGKPIHTSTGLMCLLRNSQDDAAQYEAYAMEFDHDAILLDEPGAATPDQGVGMMVNGASVRVINSSLDDEIDYLGQELVRAVSRKEDASKWMQIKSAVLEALGLGGETETISNEVSDMTEVTKEQFADLSAKVNKLAEMDVAAVVNEALKPLIEAQANAAKLANAASEAKKAELVAKVANSGVMPEEVAAKLDIEALEVLANMHKTAPGVVNAFKANDGNDDFGFSAGWEGK